MSLILDALSRAERDKRATEQGVPDILSCAATGEQPARPRAWAVAGVTLLLLLALATVWWLSRDESAVGVSPSVGIDPDVVAGSTAVNAAAAVPVNQQPVDRAAALTPRVTTNSTAGARQEPDGAQRSAIDALYSTAETSGDSLAPPVTIESPAPRAVVETPIDIEQVLRGVRREQGNSALSEHPVAVLDRLSKQYRDRVPTLMYLRHDYASGRGPSTIIINGETLRAGQRTSAVEVVEILPDSVVLRFDNKEFRLRALNSWVNL